MNWVIIWIEMLKCGFEWLRQEEISKKGKKKFMRVLFNRILTFYLIRKGLCKKSVFWRKLYRLTFLGRISYDINRAWYKKLIIMDYQILFHEVIAKINKRIWQSNFRKVCKILPSVITLLVFDNKRRKKKIKWSYKNKKRPNELKPFVLELFKDFNWDPHYDIIE
jgi:hypothetical protein